MIRSPTPRGVFRQDLQLDQRQPGLAFSRAAAMKQHKMKIKVHFGCEVDNDALSVVDIFVKTYYWINVNPAWLSAGQSR